MTRLRVLLSRLIGLSHGRRRDADLRTEIDAHLAEAMDEHLRNGMTPASPNARSAVTRQSIRPESETAAHRATAQSASIRCARTCKLTLALALAPTKRIVRRHRAGKTVDVAKSHNSKKFVARFSGTGFRAPGTGSGTGFAQRARRATDLEDHTQSLLGLPLPLF